MSKITMKIPKTIIELPEHQRVTVAEHLIKALGFRATLTKQQLDQHMWKPDPHPTIASLEDLYYENLAVPLWYAMLEIYDVLGLDLPDIEELPVDTAIKKSFNVFMENTNINEELEESVRVFTKGLKRERFAYLTAEENPIYLPTNRVETPYQTDDAIDETKVTSIMSAIRLGEKLPPLIIGYDYDLHDGHHRLVASVNLGLTHVPCVVGGLDKDKVQQAEQEYRSLYKAVNTTTYDLRDLDTHAIMDWFTVELEKGIGREMLEKYPGGSWKTIRGAKVYILKNGEIAPEFRDRFEKDPYTEFRKKLKNNWEYLDNRMELFSALTERDVEKTKVEIAKNPYSGFHRILAEQGLDDLARFYTEAWQEYREQLEEAWQAFDREPIMQALETEVFNKENPPSWAKARLDDAVPPIQEFLAQYLTEEQLKSEFFMQRLFDYVNSQYHPEDKKQADYDYEMILARLLHAMRQTVGKPLPSSGKNTLTAYHGTHIASVTSILSEGFLPNGSMRDFGECTYFKSPEFDRYDREQDHTTEFVVNFFANGRCMPAVLEVEIDMSEGVLDCTKFGRPDELQELIDNTRLSTVRVDKDGHWLAKKKVLEYVAGYSFSTISEAVEYFLENPDKQGILKKHSSIFWTDEGYSLPSPYELYAWKTGTKVIIDRLDNFISEGWQIGVYDPSILKVVDVGKKGVNSPQQFQLEKAIKQNSGLLPYCLLDVQRKDGKYVLYVGAHFENFSPNEGIEKGFGNDMFRKYPGGRWVTMNSRHVYIKKDGTPADETAPEGLKDAEPVDNPVLNELTELAQSSATDLDFFGQVLDKYSKKWDKVKDLLPPSDKGTGTRIRDFWRTVTEDGSVFTGKEYKEYPGKYTDYKVKPLETIPKITFRKKEGHHAEASVQQGEDGVEIVLGKLLDPFYRDLDNAVEAVLTHEIGHVISSIHPDLEQQIVENYGGALGKFNTRTGKFEGVTFAGTTPEESWAEAYSIYHTDPDYLRINYPEAYKMVEHVLNQIPYHNEIRERLLEEFKTFSSSEVTKSIKDDDDNSKKKRELLGKVRRRYKARLRYRPDGRPYTLRQLQDLEKILRKYHVDPDVFAESMAVRATVIGKLIAEGDARNKEIVLSMVEDMPTKIEQVRKPFRLTLKDGGTLPVLPLQSQEINAIRWASQFAGEHIRSTQEDLISGVKLLVGQARRERWEPKRLEQALFDRFGQYNRDWRRIALTELAEATNNGYLMQLQDGEKVQGQSAVDCCEACEKLVNNKIYTFRSEPGNPKTEIWVGKSNYGLKRREWNPAVIIHPHCLTAGHKVSILGGTRNIEDIKTGDLVLTHEGRYQPVTGTSKRGYRGVILTVTTEQGTLEITPNHRVLTDRGWVEAELLQEGDNIIHIP